eukprot:gnl/Dysnectes_brevis/3509_a4455_980.p1 GENE.gnl/Dysnectes_brevis/3509_a4455_980~~gnl/Dysnectes_brevis/3509_a4455_980.p1  ORF type:complete len:148 (+),score=8.80 gnl/Dysnectes_brevis/3509_a4455_980:128-571(+)
MSSTSSLSICLRLSHIPECYLHEDVRSLVEPFGPVSNFDYNGRTGVCIVEYSLAGQLGNAAPLFAMRALDRYRLPPRDADFEPLLAELVERHDRFDRSHRPVHWKDYMHSLSRAEWRDIATLSAAQGEVWISPDAIEQIMDGPEKQK